MSDPVKLWVEALRSGKYAQTTNVLRDNHGYCCLGVACALFIEEGGDLKADRLDTGHYEYGGQGAVLPFKVQAWLGLRNRDGSWSAEDSLAERNDNGSTFADIADVIESRPEGLFTDG